MEGRKEGAVLSRLSYQWTDRQMDRQTGRWTGRWTEGRKEGRRVGGQERRREVAHTLDLHTVGKGKKGKEEGLKRRRKEGKKEGGKKEVSGDKEEAKTLNPSPYMFLGFWMTVIAELTSDNFPQTVSG